MKDVVPNVTSRVVMSKSVFFEGAHVVGDQSDLSFTLPAAIRAGIELGVEWHRRKLMLGAGYS